MPRPRLITNCVAQQYADRNERIIEFNSSQGGGLIAFRECPDGRLLVSVFNVDDTVDVPPVHKGW